MIGGLKYFIFFISFLMLTVILGKLRLDIGHLADAKCNLNHLSENSEVALFECNDMRKKHFFAILREILQPAGGAINVPTTREKSSSLF